MMVMVFIVSLSRAANSATARQSLATAMLSWLSRSTYAGYCVRAVKTRAQDR